LSRVFEVRAVGPVLACCAHTAEATGGGPGDESCAVMCRCGACLVVASGAFPHIYMGRGHSKVMCIHVHVHVCTCACTCMCMYMHLRVCVPPESTRNSAGHRASGFASDAFRPEPKIFSAACAATQDCAVVHAHPHRARHTQHFPLTTTHPANM
jgi:hypothetical protein